MKKRMICIALLLSCYVSYGQKNQKQEIRIPMEPKAWEYQPDQVEFTTHRSVPAAKALNGGLQLFLKDLVFKNGTITFDVELNENSFVGINFRESEDRKEAEHFYIRAFWPVSPLSRTTLQYATVIDGTSMWDLTDDYQAAAVVHQDQWNHVKLVIHGKQMLVYVNNLEEPALHVPLLEGVHDSGSISLNGNAIFSNLVICPDATEDLAATGGYEPTRYDPHYLKNWSVTKPVDFPLGRDIISEDLPDSAAQWTAIQAEHRALVNLSRPFGSTEMGKRRLAWVKTSIQSESKQERRLDLGFSDEVWVLINGQLLYVDKNYFGSPGMKEPRGRCTIANTSIRLPLQEGENEIMIGIANDFYGWGLIARLDSTEGIKAK